MKTKGHCETCRWWEPIDVNESQGYCRGAAPSSVEVSSGDPLAVWPVTEALDWCKAWEDDEEPMS